MKLLKFLGRILAAVIALAVAAFAATQAVYWFNLDNKVIFLLYKILHKHYDNTEHDRRF